MRQEIVYLRLRSVGEDSSLYSIHQKQIMLLHRLWSYGIPLRQTKESLDRVRKITNNKGECLPAIEVIFYQEENGEAPLMEWLDSLMAKAQDKCLARLKRLEDLGHELRRPEADYLRDGVYELRVSLQGIQYRMLYFFHGKVAAVVSHGIVKGQKAPPKEIDRAVERKKKFTANPQRHAFKPEC